MHWHIYARTASPHRCAERYAYLLEPGHEDDLDKFSRGWCPCCIGICSK